LNKIFEKDNVVLVTGANGFIGKSLCIHLINAGYNVRAAVRDSEKEKKLLQEIERYFGNTKILGVFQVIKVGDVDGDTNWSEALAGVSIVVHLAGRAHLVKDTAKDSLLEYRKVNTEGVDQLARSSVDASVKRLVFISTIGVNGKSSGDGVFSEASLEKPHDPYSVSKMEAEYLLRKLGLKNKLNFVIIRPPLVYGPGNPGNFTRLVKLIRNSRVLPFGSIHNSRSFIYIDNLMSAIEMCMLHPNAIGKTYLVSDGEEISVVDLIRIIAEDLRIEIVNLPIPYWVLFFLAKIFRKENEFLSISGSLRIDSSLIQKELSWTPPSSLRQGIRKTVQKYRRE